MYKEKTAEGALLTVHVPVKALTGGSLNLLIPKPIALAFNIEKGDLLEYNIVAITKKRLGIEDKHTG